MFDRYSATCCDVGGGSLYSELVGLTLMKTLELLSEEKEDVSVVNCKYDCAVKPGWSNVNINGQFGCISTRLDPNVNVPSGFPRPKG